jgi:hypothetical protein
VTIVGVNVDTGKAQRFLDELGKQLPFATALALTKTAAIVKDDLVSNMESTFGSAVAFTLKGIYTKRATKQNLTASVGTKAQQSMWLVPEIRGGTRPGGIEVFLRPLNMPPPGYYALPASGAPLTGNAKISIPKLRQIVSIILASGQSTVSAVRSKRQSKKVQYFALAQKMGGLQPGIWGRRGRAVFPIIIFVRKPRYRKKFDFYGVGTASAEAAFPNQFNMAAAAAVATARA